MIAVLRILNLEGLFYVITNFTENYEVWHMCSRKLSLSVEGFKMH